MSDNVNLRDKLLSLSGEITKNRPGVVVSFDITDKDTVRVQIHDDKNQIVATCFAEDFYDENLYRVISDALTETWARIHMITHRWVIKA